MCQSFSSLPLSSKAQVAYHVVHICCVLSTTIAVAVACDSQHPERRLWTLEEVVGLPGAGTEFFQYFSSRENHPNHLHHAIPP